MRTLIRFAFVAAPLFVLGCKKAAPEPAAEAAPAPAPDLEWTWGPSTFAGSKDAETAGKLHVPVAVKNNTTKGLVINSYDVGVKGEDGRVCVARSETVEKSSDGTLGFTILADCMFSKIPAGEEIKLLGTLVYTLGGEELTLDVKAKSAFQP